MPKGKSIQSLLENQPEQKILIGMTVAVVFVL
jgi:hypothetical protein